MWNKVITAAQREFIDQVLHRIREEEDCGHIPQPIFIVGSSGSGKSTILDIMGSLLDRERIAEEVYLFDGKKFFSSQDIIKSIEDKISNQVPEVDRNNSQSRVVVMIDDLDYYFRRTSFEDQFRLRSYLNRETAPLLIATISGVGSYLTDYKAPFFEGIRTMYVPKFDKSSLKELNVPKEKAHRLSALMDLLPPVVRSYKTASQIVSISSQEESDIANLLERFEVWYRNTLENLPVNSQKILIALAASETAMSLSELRAPSGLQSGILSSYLRQLLKVGIIRKINPVGHGSPYEICDKLFKLWLESDIRYKR